MITASNNTEDQYFNDDKDVLDFQPEVHLDIVYEVQLESNMTAMFKLKDEEDACSWYTLVTQTKVEDILGAEEKLMFMPATLEVNGKKITLVNDFKIVAGVETATVTWRQNVCFQEFDLLVIPVEDCQNMQTEECLEEWIFQAVTGSRNHQSLNSYVVEKLQNCSQYRAILRSRGMSVDDIYVDYLAIVECSCR